VAALFRTKVSALADLGVVIAWLGWAYGEFWVRAASNDYTATAVPVETVVIAMRGVPAYADSGKMSAAQTFSIRHIPVGGGAPLFFIAGPCVIESEKHALGLGEKLAEVSRSLGIPLIFKASYDKANRSSLESFRGPGLTEGLRILRLVGERTGLPILSDVHEASQVAPAAEVCDVIQIPAFLCRQTDLLVAAARSGRVVNLKKGQFMSPWEMGNSAEKIVASGNSKLIITERGSSFGYQNLVVDVRSFPILRKLGFPVVFDVTHSVQLPGGAGKASGGQPEFIEPLARAGVAAGVDGVFMEVHEDPAHALSDGSNALALQKFPPLVEKLKQLAALARHWDAS
jgi:2-dehydro-3-deoxyphosphooctonate aldolase (KDO 8-P synthase)